jgi:DNA-binding response OmpR family regulator
MLSKLSASTQARLSSLFQISTMPDARHESALGGMRVLLVHRDPEPGLVRTLVSAGHDVLTVGVEERPAGLLPAFKPDVVLVVAPDAWDASRDLRRHSLDVPIIAIVATSDGDDRIAALAAGADDCLGRPFHRGELIARIHAACRRRLWAAANTRATEQHTSEGPP